MLSASERPSSPVHTRKARQDDATEAAPNLEPQDEVLGHHTYSAQKAQQGGTTRFSRSQATRWYALYIEIFIRLLLTYKTGHANFLDVLIDELDTDKAEEEQQEQAVSPVKEEPSPTEEVEELIEDNTESDSEEWSDDEDDEDHSLLRTMSKRPDVKSKNEAYDDIRISPSEDGGDYFQHVTHGAVEAISPSNAPGYPPNDDKDRAFNVTVTNSLVELMDNLGREVQEPEIGRAHV